MLHGLADRVAIAQIDDWEIRQHDPSRFAYFAGRGFVHLQLWNRRSRTSVLTPSRLTSQRFEVADATGRRTLAETWSRVRELVADETLPGEAEMAALLAWLVRRREAS